MNRRVVRTTALLLLAAACRADRDVAAPADPQLFGPAARHLAPVVLVGAGDIAECGNAADESTAAVLDTIPGTVFTAGDNAYPDGSDADYANCYAPGWGRHKARTRPAAGNHEYNTPGATGYFNYFGAAAGQPGQGWYSYDLGAWHIVVLNSSVDISAGSPQLQWLATDLAAADRRCTAAIWHHPRFSSGTVYPSNARWQPPWDVLYEYGAEFIVNGHEHHYERFAPQKPGGAADSRYGIREFVIGTGGDKGSPFGPAQPNSEVRDHSSYGVIRFTLSEGRYDWEFVPAGGAGRFTDRGRGDCHGRPKANLPPVAIPGGPYASDGTVRFDGRRSLDADQDLPLTWAWSFGDGRSSSGAAPTHTYGLDGIYMASLIVTDARGARSAPVVTPVVITNHAAAPVIVSAAGNIARCSNTNAEATATILDSTPGWVLTLGDNAFPGGSAADYRDCYDPTWGRHRGRTWAALGNHEYDAGNAGPAFDYFGAAIGPRDKGYYSFDLGAWHIVVLNDNTPLVPFAAGSAQEQWLRADLAATNQACVMAAWHTPLYLSTGTAGYTANPSRRALWDALFAAGADVVLNGNQHHYERMAPMRPDGTRDDTTGLRQFNVGTGGESLGLPTVAIHPNSEVRAAVYGVLRLTLRPNGYDWRFQPVAGQTFSDAGSQACH